jgi:hypothetical protein
MVPSAQHSCDRTAQLIGGTYGLQIGTGFTGYPSPTVRFFSHDFFSIHVAESATERLRNSDDAVLIAMSNC